MNIYTSLSPSSSSSSSSSLHHRQHRHHPLHVAMCGRMFSIYIGLRILYPCSWCGSLSGNWCESCAERSLSGVVNHFCVCFASALFTSVGCADYRIKCIMRSLLNRWGWSDGTLLWIQTPTDLSGNLVGEVDAHYPVDAEAESRHAPLCVHQNLFRATAFTFVTVCFSFERSRPSGLLKTMTNLTKFLETKLARQLCQNNYIWSDLRFCCAFSIL